MMASLCLRFTWFNSNLTGHDMTEEVFGKLKDLHSDVRARIEASPDWKILQAIERAMGEVRSFLPAPVAEGAAADVACVAGAAPKEAAETVTADAGGEDGPADDSGDVAAAAAAEVVADADVSQPPAAEAVVEDAATTDAPAETAAAETAAAAVPDDVKDIVADVTAAAGDAATTTNGTATH